MAIVIALLGFNNRGRSVTLSYLHIVQKRTKNQCGKLKQFQDFCPLDIEFCHLATARRVKLWSLNENLFNKGPHQLTNKSLIKST